MRGLHHETSCGHLVKVLFWDGQGLVPYAKRLERGRFVWPTNTEGWCR
jgi:transposase